MKFAAREANFGGGGSPWGPFSLSLSSFFSPFLSGRSPDITQILLIGTLSLNSINKGTWNTEYVVCAVLYEINSTL